MKEIETITAHYEKCLEQYDDGHLAVDWPNQLDAIKRYDVMLSMIDYKNGNRLLDFGCGVGGLYEHIIASNYNIDYTGIDISQKFIQKCKDKFPEASFICLNVLEEKLNMQWDWVICNGVFTEKLSLSYNVMWKFVKKMLTAIFDITKHGLAFNVMSKEVDYEKDYLFHLPIETAIRFVKTLSRRFTIKHMDYGLYEYTIFIQKV
jgi:SAM-dependent methyltransferase